MITCNNSVTPGSPLLKAAPERISRNTHSAKYELRFEADEYEYNLNGTPWLNLAHGSMSLPPNSERVK